MSTLLQLYKWQVGLFVALLVMVWPYFQIVRDWMATNVIPKGMGMNDIVVNIIITVILIELLTFVGFYIWREQRPTRKTRTSNS